MSKLLAMQNQTEQTYQSTPISTNPNQSKKHDAIKQINLKAIQKLIDENAIDVIHTTPRCAIYSYQVEKKKDQFDKTSPTRKSKTGKVQKPEPLVWQKTGVEGSLYLYRYQNPHLKTQTGFAFAVLNKSDNKTIIQDLAKVKIQPKLPYILYKNAQNQIYGIWFSDAFTFQQTSKIFQEHIDVLENSDENGHSLVGSSNNKKETQHRKSLNSNSKQEKENGKHELTRETSQETTTEADHLAYRKQMSLERGKKREKKKSQSEKGSPKKNKDKGKDKDKKDRVTLKDPAIINNKTTNNSKPSSNSAINPIFESLNQNLKTKNNHSSSNPMSAFNNLVSNVQPNRKTTDPFQLLIQQTEQYNHIDKERESKSKPASESQNTKTPEKLQKLIEIQEREARMEKIRISGGSSKRNSRQNSNSNSRNRVQNDESLETTPRLTRNLDRSKRRRSSGLSKEKNGNSQVKILNQNQNSPLVNAVQNTLGLNKKKEGQTENKNDIKILQNIPLPEMIDDSGEQPFSQSNSSSSPYQNRDQPKFTSNSKNNLPFDLKDLLPPLEPSINSSQILSSPSSHLDREPNLNLSANHDNDNAKPIPFMKQQSEPTKTFDINGLLDNMQKQHQIQNGDYGKNRNRSRSYEWDNNDNNNNNNNNFTTLILTKL